MKQINLIPAEFAHAQYVRRRACMWGMMVALCLAMLGALWFSFDKQLDTLKAEHKRLQAEQDYYDGINNRIQQILVDRNRIVEQLHALQRIQQRRVISAMLYEVAESCNDKAQVFIVEGRVGAEQPQSVAIILPRPGGQQPEPAKEANNQLVLRGYALSGHDLTNFMSGVKEAAIFQDVRLKYRRQENLGNARLENFEMELTPDTET